MKINEVIGSYIRRFRQDNSLTLEQFSTASQKHGSGWTSGTISSMESGGSSVAALSNVLILIETMNDLDQEDTISLATLFEGASDVEIARTSNSVTTIEGPRILELLETGASQTTVSSAVELSPDDVAFGERMKQFFGTDNIDRIAEISEHVATASEKRMAKKLSVSPFVIAVSCIALYGRYLDEELDRRTDNGANPQKRGRVSRSIAEEIDNRIRSLDNQPENNGVDS